MWIPSYDHKRFFLFASMIYWKYHSSQKPDIQPVSNFLGKETTSHGQYYPKYSMLLTTMFQDMKTETMLQYPPDPSSACTTMYHSEMSHIRQTTFFYPQLQCNTCADLELLHTCAGGYITYIFFSFFMYWFFLFQISTLLHSFQYIIQVVIQFCNAYTTHVSLPVCIYIYTWINIVSAHHTCNAVHYNTDNTW